MNIPFKTIAVAIFTTTSLPGFTGAQAEQPGASHLGAYGKTSTYCGAEAIPRNQPTIPQVGCFYLSAGHRAIGTFATHSVEISIDDTGAAIFIVDGQRISESHDTASWTNLPYVTAGGVAGSSICEKPTNRNAACPSRITIFSKDPDKAILFSVSACLPPQYHLCVTTQANWDYEKSRVH
jgi:hypothetical protein